MRRHHAEQGSAEAVPQQHQGNRSGRHRDQHRQLHPLEGGSRAGDGYQHRRGGSVAVVWGSAGSGRAGEGASPPQLQRTGLGGVRWHAGLAPGPEPDACAARRGQPVAQRGGARARPLPGEEAGGAGRAPGAPGWPGGARSGRVRASPGPLGPPPSGRQELRASGRPPRAPQARACHRSAQQPPVLQPAHRAPGGWGPAQDGVQQPPGEGFGLEGQGCGPLDGAALRDLRGEEAVGHQHLGVAAGQGLPARLHRLGEPALHDPGWPGGSGVPRRRRGGGWGGAVLRRFGRKACAAAAGAPARGGAEDDRSADGEPAHGRQGQDPAQRGSPRCGAGPDLHRTLIT